MTDFSSVTIVLSGEFSVPRAQICELLESRGAIIADSFAPAFKGTGLLLTGAGTKPGKLADARLLNIPIVPEEALWKALEQRDWKPAIDGYHQKHAAKAAKRRLDQITLSPTKRRMLPSLRIPAPLQQKVVALEGQIGVGKSTLGGKLKNAYPSHVDVYEEQTNEAFLNLFYSDTKKYGFAFQWGMLKTRIYQLKLAQHDTNLKKGRKMFIWDRSMIGDYIFALWNYLTGAISNEEMDVYESEFGGGLRNLAAIEFLKNIHCLTWLNDEPAACKYRVEQIRQHESEQGIPLAYYEGIDDIHFAIFMKLFEVQQNKVIVLNWGQYHEPEAVMRHVHNIFTAKRRMGKVSYLDSVPAELSEGAVVYQSEADVVAAYENFRKTADLPEKPIDVYFPKHIMSIDPASKGVRDDHPYDIIFYQNPYKRTVLFHLSQGAHVIFYTQ